MRCITTSSSPFPRRAGYLGADDDEVAAPVERPPSSRAGFGPGSARSGGKRTGRAGLGAPWRRSSYSAAGNPRRQRHQPHPLLWYAPGWPGDSRHVGCPHDLRRQLAQPSAPMVPLQDHPERQGDDHIPRRGAHRLPGDCQRRSHRASPDPDGAALDLRHEPSHSGRYHGDRCGPHGTAPPWARAAAR